MDYHYIISTNESKFCRKCGRFRVPHDVLRCEGCINSNKGQAQIIHDALTEAYDNVIAIRRKYLTKEICLKLRKDSINGSNEPDKRD